MNEAKSTKIPNTKILINDFVLPTMFQTTILTEVSPINTYNIQIFDMLTIQTFAFDSNPLPLALKHTVVRSANHESNNKTILIPTSQKHYYAIACSPNTPILNFHNWIICDKRLGSWTLPTFISFPLGLIPKCSNG